MYCYVTTYYPSCYVLLAILHYILISPKESTLQGHVVPTLVEFQHFQSCQIFHVFIHLPRLVTCVIS